MRDYDRLTSENVKYLSTIDSLNEKLEKQNIDLTAYQHMLQIETKKEEESDPEEITPEENYTATIIKENSELIVRVSNLSSELSKYFETFETMKSKYESEIYIQRNTNEQLNKLILNL